MWSWEGVRTVRVKIGLFNFRVYLPFQGPYFRGTGNTSGGLRHGHSGGRLSRESSRNRVLWSQWGCPTSIASQVKAWLAVRACLKNLCCAIISYMNWLLLEEKEDNKRWEHYWKCFSVYDIKFTWTENEFWILFFLAIRISLVQRTFGSIKDSPFFLLLKIEGIKQLFFSSSLKNRDHFKNVTQYLL